LKNTKNGNIMLTVLAIDAPSAFTRMAQML